MFPIEGISCFRQNINFFLYIQVFVYINNQDIRNEFMEILPFPLQYKQSGVPKSYSSNK